MGAFRNVITEAQILAYNINPIAPAPPETGTNLEGKIETIISWLMWGALFAGVVGLIICGVMMIVGRRGRSQTAVEGAAGIPWVLGGLTLVAFSVGLVNAIF